MLISLKVWNGSPVRCSVAAVSVVGHLLVEVMYLLCGTSLPSIRAAEIVSDSHPIIDTEQGSPHVTPAREALGMISCSEGITASLFASEPLIHNPIAMHIDPSGRIWVAENLSYSAHPPKAPAGMRDSVVVLLDTDDDGQADTRHLFLDNLEGLTSIAVGHGGVWLMCPPRLVFVPDRDGDAVADGAAELILDGFDMPRENYHNFANGLSWGPDGWLYGRCGASCPGEIGAPGASSESRIPLRGGMWRYHPNKGLYESLCHGTTNPWGHDWDTRGECFFINTVNGHFWQMIPGSHLVRPHTIDPNPNVYQPIDFHADHWHFDTGKGWGASRDGNANNFGGGHAHSGGLIVPNDSRWPARLRDRFLTLNFHGRRVNAERLDREGSGFIARHEPDPILFGDPWFRGIDLIGMPDGRIAVLDWSDTGECHEHTGVHRSSGRIYALAGESRMPIRRLCAMESKELARLASADEWTARSARRALVDRFETDPEKAASVQIFRDFLSRSDDVIVRLRSLWALHSLDSLDENEIIELSHDPDASIRTWAVRLLVDFWPLDTVMNQRPRPDHVISPASLAMLLRLAEQDSSPEVRLAIASSLQRLPISLRPEIAAQLVSHASDASDHNLPLMIWYGLMPLIDTHPQSLVDVFAACRLPITRVLIARSLAERLPHSSQYFSALLDRAIKGTDDLQTDLLAGLSEGLRGRHRVMKPDGWDSFRTAVLEAHASLQETFDSLDAVFGDGRAIEELQRLVRDAQAPLETRRMALATLVEIRAPDLKQLCEEMLKVRFVNIAAARGLAIDPDASGATMILKHYGSFHPSDHAALITILVSRPSFAHVLLENIDKEKVPRKDLSALAVRQILSLDDAELSEHLRRVWGDSRESPEGKRAAIATLKATLQNQSLSKADPQAGRGTYAKLCGACHVLYGVGGTLGPDLTGSSRHNLDYLLTNMIDPSAVVTADYRMSVVHLTDGRVLGGLISQQSDRSITLRNPTESFVLVRDDIESIRDSGVSIMPEGQLALLSENEIRDLVAYLTSAVQVPLK